MAEARNDVLMCLFGDGGALDAESTSALVAADTLTQADFKAGKFFELESFNFGLRLKDDDKIGAGAATGRSYEAWRAAKTEAAKSAKQLFFALPDELTVVRDMDKASPMLLKTCLDGKVLKRAVLVKRGRNAAGDLTGFLKMEFSDVRVRSVDWSDGDTVRETCKFKFGKLSVVYVTRKPDGSTQAKAEGTWSSADG